MIEAEVGVPVPLELMLPDGHENKGVRAFLQGGDGSDLGTIDLAHMKRGRYAALVTLTQEGYVYADFITYSDQTYQFEDLLYTRRSEVYRVTPAIDLAAEFASVPAGVWAFPERLFTNDLSSLATAAELAVLKSQLETDLAKVQYVNKMSTTFDTITGQQEIIVWPEKDGVLTRGAACGVTVRNAAGSLIWQASVSMPNADGVYRFASPIDAPGDANFYVVISAVVDGAVRTNIQTFFTVA